MSTSDDKAFEHYLQNDSALTAAYRQASDSGPPAHIDSAVLTAARFQADKPVAGKWLRRPWFAPLATTLSAVVVAGIVLVNDIESVDTIPDETAVTSQEQFKQPAAAGSQMAVGNPDTRDDPQQSVLRTATGTGGELDANDGADRSPATARTPRRLDSPSAADQYRGAGLDATVVPTAGAQTRNLTSNQQALLESNADPYQNAEDWMEAIIAYRVAGRHDQAQDLLTAFMARYPDIPVPAQAFRQN
jgi:hypothetical protein